MNKVAMTEAEIRDDERQACWEDVIHVIRLAVDDCAVEGVDPEAINALYGAIWEQGWKDFGTGDGKPMHRRVDSAVEQWKKRER